jgi:hypothetical protein
VAGIRRGSVHGLAVAGELSSRRRQATACLKPLKKENFSVSRVRFEIRVSGSFLSAGEFVRANFVLGIGDASVHA